MSKNSISAPIFALEHVKEVKLAILILTHFLSKILMKAHMTQIQRYIPWNVKIAISPMPYVSVCLLSDSENSYARRWCPPLPELCTRTLNTQARLIVERGRNGKIGYFQYFVKTGSIGNLPSYAKNDQNFCFSNMHLIHLSGVVLWSEFDFRNQKFILSSFDVWIAELNFGCSLSMVFCKEFGKKEKVFGINLGIDASKLL